MSDLHNSKQIKQPKKWNTIAKITKITLESIFKFKSKHGICADRKMKNKLKLVIRHWERINGQIEEV
jgi:hypothetical protein